MPIMLNVYNSKYNNCFYTEYEREYEMPEHGKRSFVITMFVIIIILKSLSRICLHIS